MGYYTDNEIDEALILRAISAFFRYGGTNQPSKYSSVEVVNGKKYIVLINVNRILAVYRVRNDGKLKSLKRYPKVFDKLIG